MRRQRTINVDGHKITVATRTRTYMGNWVGFSAKVHDNRGNELSIKHIGVWDRQDAEDEAYSKFVKRFC